MGRKTTPCGVAHRPPPRTPGRGLYLSTRPCRPPPLPQGSACRATGEAGSRLAWTRCFPTRLRALHGGRNDPCSRPRPHLKAAGIRQGLGSGALKAETTLGPGSAGERHGHLPRDSAKIPRSLVCVGLLPGEPNLQQLLGPFENMCSFHHRETANNQQPQKIN